VQVEAGTVTGPKIPFKLRTERPLSSSRLRRVPPLPGFGYRKLVFPYRRRVGCAGQVTTNRGGTAGNLPSLRTGGFCLARSEEETP